MNQEQQAKYDLIAAAFKEFTKQLSDKAAADSSQLPAYAFFVSHARIIREIIHEQVTKDSVKQPKDSENDDANLPVQVP